MAPRRPKPDPPNPMKRDESTGSRQSPPESDVAVPKVPLHSDVLPSLAKFERGQWLYGMQQATPRGARVMWHPSKRFNDQLESDHFVSLRDIWLASQGPDSAVVAALVAYEQSAFEG
jgi:hypothetical protein